MIDSFIIGLKSYKALGASFDIFLARQLKPLILGSWAMKFLYCFTFAASLSNGLYSGI
jgi:hypothetical protein